MGSIISGEIQRIAGTGLRIGELLDAALGIVQRVPSGPAKLADYEYEELAPSRRHRRLVNQYRDVAVTTYREAAQIVERWRACGDTANRQRRLMNYADYRRATAFRENGIEWHMAAYPDVIALTTVLVDPHWRQYAASTPEGDSAGTRVHLRKCALYDEISSGLGLDGRPRSYDDPLAHWVIEQERSDITVHTNAAKTPAQRRQLCERIDHGEPSVISPRATTSRVELSRNGIDGGPNSVRSGYTTRPQRRSVDQQR
jgi:hypothetical protein